MPPKTMFYGKQRPKGLEFPACEGCNHGSSHADLVASLIGRTQLAEPTSAQIQEFAGILSAVRNNIPGLIDEMFAEAPRDER